MENILLLKAEDLRSIIGDIVADVLEAKRAQSDGQLYSKAATIELLDVDASTLWRWEKSRYLTPVRIGSKVYYKAEDVNRMKEGKR